MHLNGIGYPQDIERARSMLAELQNSPHLDRNKKAPAYLTLKKIISAEDYLIQFYMEGERLANTSGSKIEKLLKYERWAER